MTRFAISGMLAAVLVAAHGQAGREAPAPKPTLPNPYRLVPDWPTLPASMKGPNGKKWGEVIRVHVAENGNICRRRIQQPQEVRSRADEVNQ